MISCQGFGHVGLQRLARDVLGRELEKKVEIRCGNWEAAALSLAQVRFLSFCYRPCLVAQEA